MRTQMAIQSMQMGRLDQARALCLQAVAADPADLSALRLLVQIHGQLGETAELTAMLAALRPPASDNADFLSALGAELRDHGCFAAARDAFVRALQWQPGRTDAYYNLALMTRYSVADGEVAAMEALYAQTPVDSKERRELCFALGKVFDDLGDFDKAFGFFREGNDIVYRASGHSMETDRRWFAAVRSAFGAEFFGRMAGVGCDSRMPIFIAGLPRSGTTLVEQILASHPEVHGGGESTSLHDTVTRLTDSAGPGFPAGYDRLDPDRVRDRTRAMLGAFDAAAGGKARVTNKGITNFVYIGLISVMMPNAVIVECRRDPRDQGLSLYQKDLHEQPYGYDLASIGACYRHYDELMAHWARMLPGRVLTLHYEELVADPETGIRRLLDHCDLRFDAACLAFHETKRAVRTVSHVQVRRPVYRDAVGRWRNYERHLGPLIAALGRDGAVHA